MPIGSAKPRELAAGLRIPIIPESQVVAEVNLLGLAAGLLFKPIGQAGAIVASLSNLDAQGLAPVSGKLVARIFGDDLGISRSGIEPPIFEPSVTFKVRAKDNIRLRTRNERGQEGKADYRNW
ncbi:MAG: hypothetical protein OSA93_13745 [Akkermansiaceae bacterium]|nr:hypothetical protein [Akkermansiaceae bacterium]